MFGAKSATLTGSLAAIALVAAMAATPARAENERIEVGVLKCEVVKADTSLLGSWRDLACRFRGPNVRETYRGEIARFGLELGQAKTTTIWWAVFAPATGSYKGVLEGQYTGVSAEVTPGAGVGANVLIGGFDRSITLQPISVQGQTGLNIGAGVAGLRLMEK